MRRLVICLALVTGCRSFDVNAFGVPLSPREPRLMAAGESDDGFSIWTVLAIVAANVAAVFAVQQIRHY